MVKNKKLLALNILLAILVVATAYGLYSRITAANERYAILHPDGPAKDVPDYGGPSAARRVRAGDHLPIVDRLLFSADRNPIIEVAEPVAPPPEPRPPLPRLVGVMELGQGPVALMSPDLESRAGPVAVGEKVGAFTFLGTEGEKVLLQWKEEKIAALPSELRGSPGGGDGGRQPTTRAAGGGPRRGPSRGSLTPSQALAERNKTARKNPVKAPAGVGGDYSIGAEMGGGRYRASRGDSSPAGTRSRGFVKRSQQTPFGAKQWWEKEKK
jgi:hypothetical protein